MPPRNSGPSSVSSARPQFEVRLDLPQPGQEIPVPVDPASQGRPVADQRLMHDLRGLLRRARYAGHDQPVFLTGQTLRQRPHLIAKLAALGDTPRVLLALARRYQPGEQALKMRLHERVRAVLGHPGEDRLGPLRQRALHPANGIVALARDLSPLLPPPHFPQRELQQRQSCPACSRHRRAGSRQGRVRKTPWRFRRAVDRQPQFFPVHRAEIFHMALQGIGKRPMSRARP